jgi:ComF family protein
LDEEGRCALCRTNARGFDAAYSFGAYDGVLKKLIHLLKYDRIRTLAAPLADRLVSACPLDQRFDAIVPMPLHWFRHWRRGYNQATLLARELARRGGLPLLRGARRSRATPPQAGLSGARRRAIVAGAFQPLRGRPLQGMRVLLVDDVFTTGATMDECSSVLKAAGASNVTALTLARAVD